MFSFRSCCHIEQQEEAHSNIVKYSGRVQGAAVAACEHHPSYGANPGAPAFPLAGILPSILYNKHRYYEWTCELFDSSPSLTRRVMVGRTLVLWTADLQVVQHILKSHFLNYPKGPSFYRFFADLLGNGIFNCDGALWRFQRKIASHVFTTNSLRDFLIAIADAEVGGRLLRAVDSTHGFMDLQALLMRYTCQLTFGTDPACLDSSKLKRTDFLGNSASAADYDSNALHDGPMHTTYAKVPEHLIEDFVQAFQISLTIIAERFLVPNIIWNLKRSLKVGSERRLMNALAVINKFTSFAFEQRKRDLESGKDRKDLLAGFMLLSKDLGEVAANNDEQEGLNMTDAFLKDILLSFILAGRELQEILSYGSSRESLETYGGTPSAQ
ncbi:hypothetical protein L7F22_058265 [Adiantum nelumboides]|nr:hypothetical protein [Adiantum nelumboides]